MYIYIYIHIYIFTHISRKCQGPKQFSSQQPTGVLQTLPESWKSPGTWVGALTLPQDLAGQNLIMSWPCCSSVYIYIYIIHMYIYVHIYICAYMYMYIDIAIDIDIE